MTLDESKPNELEGVRDGYDKWAELYDHDRNPLTALEEPRIQSAVGEVGGRSVLDLVLRRALVDGQARRLSDGHRAGRGYAGAA
jgi:hypothetical protein